MGFYRGPNIIRDGLVLYLDAANQKSYPGSGTTWNDLSGNGNNGTLVNGPTFNSENNGSIMFDGVDDTCRLPVNFFTLNSPQQGTVNLTVKIPPLNTLTSTVLFQDGGTTAQLIYFYRNSSFAVNQYAWLIYFNNTTGGTGAVLHYIPYIPGEWYTTTLTFNTEGQTSVYVNGILRNTTNVTNFTSWRRNGGNIPSFTGGSGAGIGNVSIFSYYNRALTAEEIQQNYNATKSRFNL